MTEPPGADRLRQPSRWRPAGWLVLPGLLLLSLALALPQVAPAAERTRPFSSPFAMPPGPGTWYVSQWYGATVWSARNWSAWYTAGQGVHFGVDLSALCGTGVVAIGDGVVFAVDGPYGSAPHNVVIRHANGYSSLYGHLVERSHLQAGQTIAAGELVGYVGDSDAPSCDRAPHLHLEIRYDSMRRTTNPVNLVELEWADATIGIRDPGTTFAVDLDQPDRWQTIYDQPDVLFGGPVFWGSGERIWPP